MPPFRRAGKRHTPLRLVFQVTTDLAGVADGSGYYYSARVFRVSRTVGVRTMAYIRHFDSGSRLRDKSRLPPQQGRALSWTGDWRRTCCREQAATGSVEVIDVPPRIAEYPAYASASPSRIAYRASSTRSWMSSLDIRLVVCRLTVLTLMCMVRAISFLAIPRAR